MRSQAMYDRLYADPRIWEVPCWIHARRKFLEVSELMTEPGRAHESIAFIQALNRIERKRSIKCGLAWATPWSQTVLILRSH